MAQLPDTSVEQALQDSEGSREVIRIPRATLVLGLLFLVLVMIFVLRHLGDAGRFILLLEQARPAWLLLVILFQVSTYACVGLTWNAILRRGGYRTRLGELSRLAVEKLSIDQLVPAVGLSGNLAVFRAMKRHGIPHARSLEAILVNILAHYIAYALVSVGAWITLWIFNDTTMLTRSLIGAFVIILVAVPVVIIWMMAHKDKPLPAWLRRFGAARRTHADMQEVSPERVYAPGLLFIATLLNLAVFLLDSLTLWACMQALGIEAHILTAFAALVMASIAATLSLLPGGVGGFEAASVAVLHLLGVPIEAALTGTLLLRGFTLWLPMIPGLLFARRDVIMKV